MFINSNMIKTIASNTFYSSWLWKQCRKSLSCLNGAANALVVDHLRPITLSRDTKIALFNPKGTVNTSVLYMRDPPPENKGIFLHLHVWRQATHRCLDCVQNYLKINMVREQQRPGNKSTSQVNSPVRFALTRYVSVTPILPFVRWGVRES